MNMNDVKIRACTEKDNMKISILLRCMLEHMSDSGGHRVNPNETFWQDLPIKVRGTDRKCLVAGQNSELIAFVLANIQPLDNVFVPMQSLHINAIYVCPEFRRRGLAEQLMSQIFQWGQAEGCQQVDLNVLPQNEALRYYERLGFKVFQHSMTKELK